MAEFQEVIKQFKRMCWYYSRDKVQKSCPMCTSYPNCNIGQCRKIAFEKPAHFAATVMRWAAEHPVVYPTWGEWFVSIGMLPEKWDNLTSAYMNVGCVPNLIHSSIPADLAKKLGIEPKEVV